MPYRKADRQMAYLRANQPEIETTTLRGVTHASRLTNASALEMFTESIPMRPDWWDDAECRGMGTDLFFPTRGEASEQAKATCEGCKARPQCEEASLWEHYGIWAGRSERERRRLRGWAS